jgi:hypothetical protein
MKAIRGTIIKIWGQNISLRIRIRYPNPKKIICGSESESEKNEFGTTTLGQSDFEYSNILQQTLCIVRAMNWTLFIQYVYKYYHYLGTGTFGVSAERKVYERQKS